MMFLIAGAAATGKSTVCAEFKDRGYAAYDVDVDGLGKWRNTGTGYVHPKSSVKLADRSPEFLATHEWAVPKAELEAIALGHHHEAVFICGAMSNVAELLDLFDKKIALHVRKPLLASRLEKRAGDDWGAQSSEREITLREYDGDVNRFKSLGYTMIESSLPVAELADSIVAICVPGSI